jgi:hypothetical protein
MSVCYFALPFSRASVILNIRCLSYIVGSEALRKVIVRRGDDVIELELSDEEVREFFELPLKSGKIQKEKTQQIITRKVKSEPIIKQGRLSLASDEWQLVVESEAEIRGRADQSKYFLYTSRSNGDLRGIIKSKSQHTKLNLGNPSDTSSPISVIKKAVNAMPLHDAFTRRSISESIPSGLAKGHFMKFALDYMEKIGLVTKLKEREIGGALLYKRVSQVGSSNKFGSEAGAAVLDLNTTEP